MSKIKVWTSDGEWSKEVEGLDKIHLIKRAILIGTKRFKKYPFEGYEIDSLELYDEIGIIYSGEDDEDYFKEVDELIARGIHRSNFKEAKTFKLPLDKLLEIKGSDRLCTPLYDELLTAAKVPSTASKDYCLLLKFEDE